MESQKTIYFQGLNFLRFVAAFMLIIYHSALDLPETVGQTLKLSLRNLLVGVDLFFIISGFLIVYLLLAEKQVNGKVNILSFFIRRVLRIFPLYFLVIAIGYYVCHPTLPDVDFTKYLYFCSNFEMIRTDTWMCGMLAQTWSLCIEEHFYLVIPFLAAFIPSKKLIYVFGAIFFASLFYRIYIVQNVQYNWFILYCHTLSRCDLLAVSGILACWHHQKGIVFNHSLWLSFVALLMYLFVCSQLNFSDFETFFRGTFQKYIFVIPMLYLFMSIVFNSNENLLLNKLRNNTFINYLGKISFGLYMFHTLVIDLIDMQNGVKGLYFLD